MKTMTSRNLTIIELIDWYDGIVQAVVSISSMEGAYLCSLISFDAESKQRVFALLPLAADELCEIRFLLKKQWDDVISYLSELWSKFTDDTLLVCCNNDQEVVAERIIQSSSLKSGVVLDIEAAAEESRMFWFQIF